MAASNLSSFAHAAAGIDHGDRVVADDESDIGNRALVLARHQRDFADMHEYAGRNFGDGQFLLLRCDEASTCEHASASQNQRA